ncbi:hypothetical protein DL96DRAFT_775400 [Flagelloscypha sp. PMI_526]|nr:hypothetical protein DL96DRAFT_775400 [Flagelloscypha sp. PMI_526]
MLTLVLISLVSITFLVSPSYAHFEGLKVSIAANDVSSIADLKVDATVANVSPEDVKILKYGTVLDNNLPTKSFTLTKNGTDVAFIGARIQVQSLENLSNDAWITIPSGKNVTVRHMIEKLYDFELAGTGRYSIKPNIEFQLAGTNGVINTLDSLSRAVAPDVDPISINISGDVARREVSTP